MVNQIRQRLEQAFPSAKIFVEDMAEHHATHHAPGEHFSVHVIWQGFSGKSLVEQHQLVYTALQEEMKQKIHALQIKTEVPNNG